MFKRFGNEALPWIRKRATENITLSNDGNIAYYMPIQVGTPPKQFNVLIDSGSHLTFLGSVDCPRGSCNNLHYYNHSGSSTSTRTGVDDSIIFAQGNVNGFITRVI